MKIRKNVFLCSLLLIVNACTPASDSSADLDNSSNNPNAENIYTLYEPGDGEYNFTPIVEREFSEGVAEHLYESVGVGGGGAMSGFSISPYSSLWFVGTDMGTLYRSLNRGASWIPVHHFQTTFSSDLESSVGVGFSSDPKVVFHAPAGVRPVISEDTGKTWKRVIFDLQTGEKIRYWRSHSYDSRFMYAATNKGLWQSRDIGLTWDRLDIDGESKGTYIDYHKDGHILYHATTAGIYKSIDEGRSFSLFHKGSTSIRSFAAGRDAGQITFSYIDSDGKNACSSVSKYAADWGAASMDKHYAHCGYVWIAHDDGVFIRTNKEGGDHIKMSENNSQTIYVAGSTSWIRQYGTKVWKSVDSGASWTLKLNQIDWDVNPYPAWGRDKIEYSAAALDIGWFDSGYESFDIHQRKPSSVGGTGYFFLHSSKDGGNFWNAPFTKFADTGAPEKAKKWKSTGLEVTSVYHFKFHPNNSQVGYAAMADVGGMVTEDGGKTFRLSKAYYNSNYDYAFDPQNDRLVWSVSGAEHDYPMGWHANITKSEGGVYQSTDRGLTWKRLTPDSTQFNRQFLSIGYDSINGVLYAGSQGDGVARSRDRGVTWEYFNSGLPSSGKIISQIEVDPNNGDVYALLTGDAPTFSNQEQTGIYLLASGGASWKLLRKTLNRPTSVDSSTKLWYYPTSFAVDFSGTSNPKTLWLTDYENNKNWLATGAWKSTDGGNMWDRQIQYTHPLTITLDQEDPSSIYVNGLWQLDGQWGDGGLYYTNDSGVTWKKNNAIPYQHNGRSATIDPNDNSKIFYNFFGSAILHGPRPN